MRVNVDNIFGLFDSEDSGKPKIGEAITLENYQEHPLYWVGMFKKLIHNHKNFNITIWNTEGELVKSMKESGYNIFQGLLIDFSTLSPGGYILKIESPEYIEALKFIKTN